MKKLLITFITTGIGSICLLTLTNVFGGVIMLEGNYQGKNLFVQNPYNSGDGTFCSMEVLINDVKEVDEHNSSAYEINLSKFNIGDKVTIKIKHKENCKPKVINPEVLKPRTTCEITSLNIEEGLVQWVTQGESGPLPFIVEQFKNNKWVPVGEEQGKGTPDVNTYSQKLKFHSGVNKFRIKQTDFTGKSQYSKVTEITSTNPEINFWPIRVSKDIYFSEETAYEIFDSYGNLVKKGFDKQVDLSGLPKGNYYLNIDNRTEKFLKK